MEITPHLLPTPAPAAAPSALLLGLHEAATEVTERLYGNSDPLEPLHARLVALHDATYVETRYWVALPAGVAPPEASPRDVLGYLEAGLPVTDNRAVAPEAPWQEDTLVRVDHRGHRLGLLVKAANLLRLAEANPAARRVRTWNADENATCWPSTPAWAFTPSASSARGNGARDPFTFTP